MRRLKSDLVRRVEEVLCRHLRLRLPAAEDIAHQFASPIFFGEKEVSDALNQARKAADDLAQAITDLSPAISRGAIDPKAFAGWPLALCYLSNTFTTASISQTTKPRAAWVADQAADLWKKSRKQEATVSVRTISDDSPRTSHTETGSPFVSFLTDLYAALGIKAKAVSQAQQARKRQLARNKIKSRS